MYRYAQIDLETGMVLGDSHLSGEVDSPNLIPIAEDLDLTNKRYIDGGWVEHIPEPVETEQEPSEQEMITAELLLNQATILSNQNAADEVLAAILLNQIGG